MNEEFENIDSIKDKIEELSKYAERQYNKAIDDFADSLVKYLGVENATKYGNKNAEQQRNSYDTLMKYEIADSIEDVAEQLKDGTKKEAVKIISHCGSLEQALETFLRMNQIPQDSKLSVDLMEYVNLVEQSNKESVQALKSVLEGNHEVN